jgi:hypothetical protein
MEGQKRYECIGQSILWAEVFPGRSECRAKAVSNRSHAGRCLFYKRDIMQLFSADTTMAHTQFGPETAKSLK